MAKQYDLLVKLLLIGDSGVGKTCMIWRFADDQFHNDTKMSTIGIDFKIKSVEINDKKVRIQLWDTAGQERYETLTKQYYRRAQGIFLVYDISNENSFDNLQKWIDYVREYASDDCCLMLIANKCDKDERKIDQDRGEKLAQELGIPFHETSAKESDNIEKAFIDMAAEVIQRHKKEYDAIQLDRQDSDGDLYVSELLREKNQGSCCTLS